MTQKRAGIVTGVLAANRVNVSTGPGGADPSAGNIPNVPYPPGYAPQVGDSVIIDYLVDTPFVVAVLTPNRSITFPTVSVVNSNPGGLTAISTVLADPSTSTNPALTLVRTTPVAVASSITVNAASSGSWSPDWPTWRSDDKNTRQGDYGSGQNYGLWFYGAAAFSALSGHTVTGVLMTIVRAGFSGTSWGPMQLRLWLHNYATKPAGQPTLIGSVSTDAAGANPSLGASVTFNLPTSWGTQLGAGSAAGVAIASPNASDSLVCVGPDVAASSGTLVITYV